MQLLWTPSESLQEIAGSIHFNWVPKRGSKMKQGRQLLTYHLGILGPDLVARLPFLNLFNGFPQLVQWIRTPRAPLTHFFLTLSLSSLFFGMKFGDFFPSDPRCHGSKDLRVSSSLCSWPWTQRSLAPPLRQEVKHLFGLLEWYYTNFQCKVILVHIIIWYYMILYDIIWYYMLYMLLFHAIGYSILFHWSCESSAEYQLLFYNLNIVVRLKMLNDACILDQRWKYRSKRRNRWKLKPCSYSHFHVLPTCLSIPLCLAVVRRKYVFSNDIRWTSQQCCYPSL